MRGNVGRCGGVVDLNVLVRVSAAERAGLSALLREHALVVSEPTIVEAITGDPEDDRVVAAPRAVGAELIVSGDRHLLDQARPRPPVLTPAEFLGLVT